MGVRLIGTYNGKITGSQREVQIYDTAHSDPAITIEIKSCSIQYDSSDNDDVHSPILSSRASIGIAVTAGDTDVETFITDYASGEENRFFVQITDGGNPVWRGILTPDFAGEEDTSPIYVFNVSAICGLALLKKKPYHDGTALYSGIQRFTEHIATCLNELPHISTWWITTQALLKTSVDWWESSMSTSTSDALYQGGVDHAAFYDYKTAGDLDKDVLSCYGVIEAIMNAMGARIYYYGDAFRIEQMSYRTSASYLSRRYDKDGAYLTGNTTNTGYNVINQTLSGAKIATVNYDFLPALKKSVISYEVRERRNFLAGYQDGVAIINEMIDSNGGTAITRLKFTLHWTLTNNTYSGSSGDQFFAIPYVKLNVGSYYLTRTYTISNYQANPGALSWSGAINQVPIPIYVGWLPPGVPRSGSINVELITPAIPADSDNNLFSFVDTDTVLEKWNGGAVTESQFTIDINISNVYWEIYDDGTPAASDDKVVYKYTNANEAIETYEKTTRIGTVDKPNSAGRVMYWDGSAWTAGGNWGAGVDTRNKKLGDLLAADIVNARYGLRRRLNGSILGDFVPYRLLSTTDGKKWMLSNGTWDLAADTVNGTWFELEYGNGGTHSSPIKIKILSSPNLPINPDPISSLPGLNTGSLSFYSNAAPTVLAPIAYNQLNGTIAAGATVTSIPIVTASEGNEFLAGDGVTIQDPITGKFQTFEISTPPTLGATSLSVVSEVSLYDFPQDSHLVVKQKAFSYKYTPEQAQDDVFGAVVDSTTIDFTYNDGANTFTGDVIANSIGNTHIRQSSGLSVIGRAVNTTGNVADIIAGTDAYVLMRSGTTLIFGQIVTGGITANAVTFAKIQQIATARFVGRVTAGTGDVEALTGTQATTLLDVFTSTLKGLAPASGGGTTNFLRADGTWAAPSSGGITGSGTAGQVVRWTGAATVGGDAGFTYDATNDRVTITGTLAGTGANNAWLNLNGGSITGTAEALRASANLSTALKAVIANARNLGNTGDSILEIQNGGTSGGDSFILFSFASLGTNYAVGIDNSDLDKFKITPGGTAPGSIANKGLTITTDAATLFGFNLDVPKHAGDFTGRVRASTGFIGKGNQWFSGNIAPGVGMGTTPTINSISGSDNWFAITFTTGTTPTAGGIIFTATYPNAWPGASGFSYPVFSADNDNAANEITKFRTANRNAATFQLTTRAGQALTASTAYALVFHIGGYDT